MITLRPPAQQSQHFRRVGPIAANVPCTIEKLRDMLEYDPETGKLIWKRRGSARFDTRHAGKEALTATVRGGLRVGKVMGNHVYAHRAAFAIHYGRWPEGEGFHLDGNRANNRAGNLVEVSISVAQIMKAASQTSDLGCKGVRRGQRVGSWEARIKIAGSLKHLGTFDTLKEALAARKAAEAILGVPYLRKALKAP